MTKLFGHHVSLEMLCLWLIEVTLSFLLLYVLLSSGDSGSASRDVIQIKVVNDALVLSLTAGATAVAIGLYRPELFLKTRRLLLNSSVAGLLAFPAVWVVGWLLGIDFGGLSDHAALWPLQLLLVWILLLFVTRVAFRLAVRMDLFVRRVLILSSDEEAARTADAMRTYRRGMFEVAGSLSVGRNCPVLVPHELRSAGIRDVILSYEASRLVLPADRQRCELKGIRVHTEPEFWERHLRRIAIDHVNDDWRQAGPRPWRNLLAAWVNRLGDVGTSATLLVLTLPLMLLTALLVRLDSPGPILYRQERVGLHGQVFTLFKFRSMRADAEARGPAWAAQRDPRVTRVGSFIRRTRIDELPQLVNVLRGQMSFIGPRPERPHFVNQLSEVIPYYRDRALVKPGLTGWAQVNFPYGASIEDAKIKLSYDLYYVKHRSLLLDINILLATVRVILFQEGAR